MNEVSPHLPSVPQKNDHMYKQTGPDSVSQFTIAYNYSQQHTSLSFAFPLLKRLP